MTPAQSRAARGFLDWSQDDLADAADVAILIVKQFENGALLPEPSLLSAMQKAFETQGVMFVSGADAEFCGINYFEQEKVRAH
jgi:ribosome-binding protein aMBF1 (putative translation factor)